MKLRQYGFLYLFFFVLAISELLRLMRKRS